MKNLRDKSRIFIVIAFFSIIQFTAHGQATKQPDKKGLTNEQLDTLKHKSGAAVVTNYDASNHMGAVRTDIVDRGWIGIKGAPSEIKLWGWVQTAVFGDFQGYELPTAQEFSAGLIPVPTVHQGSSGFDAYSSRIFFQTRHLVKGKTAIETVFIMDAGGGQAAGWAVPRIRQFYVSINNLTFGAANGTFANFNTWPGYFDRGAPGAFPLARKPVVRYAIPLDKKKTDHSVITVGIEWADTSWEDATLLTKMPDAVVRYDYSPKWGNIMLGVIARDFNAVSSDDSLPGGDEKLVWGAQFSGLWTFGKKKDHIRWVALAGPATSGYMWDTGFEPGNNGVYDTTDQTLYTMNAWGAYVSYEHMWSKKLYSMFMLSYADIENIEQQPTNAFNNSTTGTVTLRWEVWKDMFLAGEYFYGKRVNFDNQSGYNNRLNIVFRYMFNH